MGVGRNLKEAEKIVYFIANGRKIAIVAATQIERFESFTKEAGGEHAGSLKDPGAGQVRESNPGGEKKTAIM